MLFFRLSLSARDSFLRLQIAELNSKIKQMSERSRVLFSASFSSKYTSSQLDAAVHTSYSCARVRPHNFSGRRRYLYRVGLKPSKDAKVASNRCVTTNSSTNSEDSVCHCICQSSTSTPCQVSCLFCQPQATRHNFDYQV